MHNVYSSYVGSIAWSYLQCMKEALLTFSRRLQPVALSKAVRSYRASFIPSVVHCSLLMSVTA